MSAANGHRAVTGSPSLTYSRRTFTATTATASFEVPDRHFVSDGSWAIAAAHQSLDLACLPWCQTHSRSPHDTRGIVRGPLVLAYCDLKMWMFCLATVVCESKTWLSHGYRSNLCRQELESTNHKTLQYMILFKTSLPSQQGHISDAGTRVLTEVKM